MHPINRLTQLTTRMVSVAALLAACVAQAQPMQPQELQLGVILHLADDIGVPWSSTFNPRFFDGFDYVGQIVTPAFGRYPIGSPIPDLMVRDGVTPREHRMVAPFRGALRNSYILGSSSGAALSTTFSRYDYNGSNVVDTATPGNQTVEGFDWADDKTIIHTIYNPSSSRKRLYLTDVTAEPFSVAPNTRWNANGYITTSVSTRIRNVRVGDRYPGYAYYGDGNQNNNPNFYAVNLATGAETLLGNAGTLTGGGSFGVWTVLERGGYLYVQTTDNGIQVYNMTSATQLGSLYATYAKAELDAVTGYTDQYFGLDVMPDGKRLTIGTSALGGVVFEIGQPQLTVSLSAGEALLSWPSSVNAVAIQAAPSLSPGAFSDIDPQPNIWVVEKMNKASIPIDTTARFFRLRKTP